MSRSLYSWWSTLFFFFWEEFSSWSDFSFRDMFYTSGHMNSLHCWSKLSKVLNLQFSNWSCDRRKSKHAGLVSLQQARWGIIARGTRTINDSLCHLLSALQNSTKFCIFYSAMYLVKDTCIIFNSPIGLVERITVIPFYRCKTTTIKIRAKRR